MNPQTTAFVDRIKRLFKLGNKEFAGDETAVQRRLSPTLRAAAINHLRTANTPVAQGFRSRYNEATRDTHENFLKAQEKNGAWGTYVEASALAEMLDCHLMVTPVTKGQEADMFCLHRASHDDAPVIHLFNSDNTHWFVNGKTLGDGNCLYNAFAEALRVFVHPEPSAPSARFFTQEPLKAEVRAIAEQQRRIEAAIKGQGKTDDHLNSVEQEQQQQRIRSLPENVQEQIARDYELALEIAAQEMPPSFRLK